jgi:hypothetical protein
VSYEWVARTTAYNKNTTKPPISGLPSAGATPACRDEDGDARIDTPLGHGLCHAELVVQGMEGYASAGNCAPTCATWDVRGMQGTPHQASPSSLFLSPC